MPMYEYKCSNEECSLNEETVERIAKMSKRDELKCKECELPIERKVSITGGPHISWSTWRI